MNTLLALNQSVYQRTRIYTHTVKCDMGINLTLPRKHFHGANEFVWTLVGSSLCFTGKPRRVRWSGHWLAFRMGWKILGLKPDGGLSQFTMTQLPVAEGTCYSLFEICRCDPCHVARVEHLLSIYVAITPLFFLCFSWN